MRKLSLLLLTILLSTWASAQISTFPHFSNFDAEADCGTSCTGGCALAGSWKNGDQYGFAAAGMKWLAHSGTTPSTATGPDFDHTTGTGRYVYGESSGCNNTTCHLVSDIYVFSALSAPKMHFWYHMYGATMGTLHIDADTSGIGTWLLDVVPSWTDNVNAWQEKTVDLSAFAGKSSVRLRIRGITGTSFTSDFAIDDINIYEPLANDIEAVSVNAGGGCGNSSTTPVTITLYNAGSDTINAGTSLPLAFMISPVTTSETFVTTMDYLPGDTFTYTFVTGFADLSGAGSVFITGWAAWAPDGAPGNDTATVTTMGIPVISSYPYFEDFESGQNGWTINNGTVGTWAFGTPAKTTISSAGSGVNSFVTGGLGTGFYNDLDNSYVLGPCFDFSTICDPVIEMKVWWNAEFSWDGMNITISTDGGTTWSLTGAYLDPFTWYTDNTIAGNPGGFQEGWSGRNSTTNGSGGWVTARHRLVGAGGFSNVKIRVNFGTDGSVTDDGVAFDDVHIFNGTDFGADQTICSPATINLNADHGNVAATYAWSTGATSSSITVSSTGTYDVTITASGTCSVTESIYVVVVDSTTAVSAGADSSYCGSTLLDAGYWPASSILWSTGDTTQTLNVSSSGTYTVDVTTSCGVLSDTVTLVISSGPVVDLGPDGTYCDDALLDAGAGASGYSWSSGDVTSAITVTSSGTYYVDVTDSAGCSNSDTISVTIATSPVVDLGADSTICAGGGLVLDAGNPGATFLWSDASTNQTLAVSGAGTYYVTVTDSSSGCSGSDSVTVGILAAPSAGFSFVVGATGLDVTFTDLSTGTITSYDWDFGDGGSSTLANPAHNYSSDGTYIVTLIVSNSCGADTFLTTVDALNAFSMNGNLPAMVYPNPNMGSFKVQFTGTGAPVGLSVINLAGQQVYARELGLVSGSTTESVDLPAQPAGIYFLQLRSGVQQTVVKLHIQ